MYWNNLEKIVNYTVIFCYNINKKVLRIIFTFLSFSIVTGCATVLVPDVESIHVDRFHSFKMPDGSEIYPSSIDAAIPDADILEIDDKIKTLLDEKIKKIRDPQDRLKMLSKILVEKISYDISGDSYGVKTAQETFDTGTGNCLSFTNLFIAMARHTGFMANFSEIPTLPNWVRDGEVLFFTRHIGATVDVRTTAIQIIQLEIIDERNRIITLDNTTRYYFAPSELAPDSSRVNTFGFTAIEDTRAFAQYYNNFGCKYLAEGNDPEAFRYFIKALKTDPGLSFAWSNLGVAYKRNSQFDAAEAAYLQGIAVIHNSKDTSLLSIMSNLVNLYEATGEYEKAANYKNQVASFREKNPYYQYLSGKTAYDNSRYEKAIDFFKKAIRLKKDEHLFYYGLALAYLKTGEIKKAERNINNAMNYSWDERRKVYYEKYLATMKKAY